MKFRVERDALADAVAWTAKSLPSRPSVPVLAGVRVELEGSTMTLLATDRYRLAIKELSWHPDAPDASLQALVPAKTLADTANALGPLGGDVTVALSRGGLGEGMIGFVGGERRTTSRLLDGEFPKVRNLLPDHHNARARIQVAALVEVVRRVALVAERTTPVRLSFSEDGLVVEAGGTEDARASEAMECGYEGEPMQVAFNPGYLLEGLNALGGPVAVLSLTDPRKPAVLAPAAEDGEISEGYRYLIMPIRIGA